MAGEGDEKMTDEWKAGVDEVLIFTRLSSAVVAAFVALSVQDLKPTSRDTSAFHLANTYKMLANSNAGSTRSGSSVWPSPSHVPC